MVTKENVYIEGFDPEVKITQISIIIYYIYIYYIYIIIYYLALNIGLPPTFIAKISRFFLNSFIDPQSENDNRFYASKM